MKKSASKVPVLDCPVCKQQKMYWTAEGIPQLDAILREKGEWLTPDYKVYRCLNNPENCSSSKEYIRYIVYTDGRIEELKAPLRTYSGHIRGK